MDNLEAALLVNVYFVLNQALLESIPSYEAPESVMVEFASIDTVALVDVQIALSATMLHKYHLKPGLICWDDDLRYWMKHYLKMWFGDFLIYIYTVIAIGFCNFE